MKRCIMGILFACLCLGSIAWGENNCLTPTKAEGILREFMPADFKILSVKPVKDIPGLCEVAIKATHKPPFIIYMDTRGKYLFSGNLFRLKDKKNLTSENAVSYWQLTKEEMKVLDKCVSFTYGQGKQSVFYITSPDCPYCATGMPVVKKWAKGKGVKLKVVLLPISSKASEKAIAIFCDKKGFSGLETNYISKNQCQAGKDKVANTLKSLQEIGIRGAPTLVSESGQVKIGNLSEEELDQLVN
ncbi:MAG: thioredoxin fold domain-containing protein [Candidatus Desulfofervidaceae bacterium]|nr:thioredoxin fold domain-containing protein [Candidatus Desulfofervidaceae bacterium]MDL1970737.1 thioredoxin fold domain-containing protein [Candidatus Desulfofervidaceae bacterium]